MAPHLSDALDRLLHLAARQHGRSAGDSAEFEHAHAVVASPHFRPPGAQPMSVHQLQPPCASATLLSALPLPTPAH